MLTPDSFDRGLDTAKRSIGGIVWLRLAGLSAEARAVAESIALLESDVNLPVLARVARIDPTSALGAVDDLDRADLISATTLVFTHPLLRDAVGASLNPQQRSTAHRRCAAILHQAGAPWNGSAGTCSRSLLEPITSWRTSCSAVPPALWRTRHQARRSGTQPRPGGKYRGWRAPAGALRTGRRMRGRRSAG